MKHFEKNRIFWEILMLWAAWLLISYSLTNGSDYPQWFVRRNIPTLIGFIMIIWINVKYLLPKFFFNKKYLHYILGGTLLLSGTVILLYHEFFPWSEWFRTLPVQVLEELKTRGINRSGEVRWMRESTPMIMAFLGSTLWEIIRFANIKEKEKLEAELKFLKSQVNPHFLFNALNNIYSLAVVQAPQTPESVMQLSEILRYMVYDSNAQKVSLDKEINYIENFVDLKLLKDSRAMNVQVDLDKTASNIMISPLLFIPFVENAFKHSKIENLKDGFIKIKLKVENKTIDFQVINSVPKNKFTQDEVGGVGLENVKKRLLLLYPEHQHELKILPSDDKFEVHLKLQIDEKN